jgi:acetolactate synthase-1/2/3 large subunit
VIPTDARRGTEALAERVAPRDVSPLRERLTALREAAWTRLRAEHPAEVAFLDTVGDALPPDAVVVCDMCIPGYWLGGFHPVPAPRRLAYPLGWGTLGFGFPASLGAALAGTGPVVSFNGDGGFLFACGELATVAQERLPLTAVIVDDGGYGMLRFDQRQAGDPTFGVDLWTPDFAALAESFGVRAERVEGLGHAFGAALARHVADPEPSVLVAHATLDPPPTTSPRWYRRP